MQQPKKCVHTLKCCILYTPYPQLCGSVAMKMMGGGQNRSKICCRAPTWVDPRTFHIAKQSPPAASHDSQLLLRAVYIARSECIWLIPSNLNEHAPTARLLNLV